MSPQSEGLFQQIIAQSGSNFSPSLHSITASEAARFGIEASIALGCVLGDGEDRRLECLQGRKKGHCRSHRAPLQGWTWRSLSGSTLCSVLI